MAPPPTTDSTISPAKAHRSYLSRLLVRFAPPFVLLLISVAALDTVTTRKNLELLESQSQQQLLIIERQLDSFYESVLSDLFYLARQKALKRFIDERDSTDELLDEYSSFSKARKRYSQIRVIALDGRELIRVNYENDAPRIVDTSQLQNKGSRPYVKKTLSLHDGQFYISEIDLNVEHGQVEIPFNPVVRAGVPLFHQDGQKAGILILNYNAQRLLSRLKQASSSSIGKPFLLNADGYWLLGAEKEHNFGFMFPEKQEATLAKTHPNDWEQIRSHENGSVLGADTLRVFRRYQSQDRTAEVFHSQTPIDGLYDQETLYLGLDIPEKQFRTITTKQRPLLFGAGVLVSALLLAMSHGFARADLHKQLRFEEIEESNLKLQELNEELQQFTHIASHDLREPLRKLHNFSDLLERSIASGNQEDIQRYLDKIRSNVKRSSELIDAFRALTKVTTHTPPPEICDLSEIVHRSLLDFQSRYTSKNIQAEVAFLPRVIGIPSLIEQLLQNLIENAFKFAVGAPPQVRIGTVETKEGVGYFVWNSGPTLTAEEAQRAFLPLVRLQNEVEGTGIGLALCRKIVERHGGKIWFDLDQADGCLIIFTLNEKDNE